MDGATLGGRSIALPDWEAEGVAMHAMVRDLYPLCRSLTGDGLRETLRRIASVAPLALHEVPSGTPVLDWTVPQEWTIRAARIEDMAGRVLVDFRDSNLHVVQYSRPVDAVLSRADLAAHIHTLPDQPDLIPYRTGYFADDWGFCLTDRQWRAMTDDRYRVLIDATIGPGALSYGEVAVPGLTGDEFIVSAHCCHPSLANDNLSGIAVAAAAARRLLARVADGYRPRVGVRFLFMPATIGAVTWLARNEARRPRLRGALVLSCLGDPGPYHYKVTRDGGRLTDRAVALAFRDLGEPLRLRPFAPVGYDERQFDSPGFAIGAGLLTRSPDREFPEYHTSADTPDLVRPEALARSLELVEATLAAVMDDAVHIRTDGRGEPQLGRRGLYRQISGQRDGFGALQDALLWVLNLSDGRHGLIAVAERSGHPFARVLVAARLALEAGLIVSAPPRRRRFRTDPSTPIRQGRPWRASHSADPAAADG